jgi:hypothetical protein
LRYANFTITNQVKKFLHDKLRLGKRFMDCKWIHDIIHITKIANGESLVEAKDIVVKIGNRKAKKFQTKDNFGKIKNHYMVENPIFSVKFIRNIQPNANHELFQRLAEISKSNFNR